jgi:hypothetical protein
MKLLQSFALPLGYNAALSIALSLGDSSAAEVYHGFFAAVKHCFLQQWFAL